MKLILLLVKADITGNGEEREGKKQTNKKTQTTFLIRLLSYEENYH